MTDAISDLAERMVRDAKVIGLQLESIRMRDPDRANLVLEAIFVAIGGENGRFSVRNAEDAAPDDIEGLIVEYLREQARPQSVAQIHDFIEETGSIDILRPSLTVKLHRMAQHGRLVNVSRGHYALPMHAAGRR